MNSSNKSYLGYILCFIGVFILTFDTLLIRLVSKQVNYWVLMCYRYFFNFTTTFIYNLYLENRNILNEVLELGMLGLLGSIFLCGCNICFTIAVISISVSNTLAIYAISPIMTSLLSKILFNEKLHSWTIVSLLCVTTTVISIIWLSLKKDNNIIGYILALLAMMTTSGYFTILRYSKINYPEKKMVLTISISSILTSLICFGVIFIKGLSINLTNKSLLWLGVQGFLILPISFICITISTKYISGTDSNLMILLETMLGPIWVYLAGIETPPKFSIIGIVIVLVFLLINTILTIRYDRKSEFNKITIINIP